MLYRLPRSIPPVPALLADLQHPTAGQLAQALDVSQRTVWRWQQAGAWPRPVELSLFFASSWGWSAVECDARYRVATAEGLADALRRELAASRSEVQRLAALGVYGSANMPTMRA